MAVLEWCKLLGGIGFLYVLLVTKVVGRRENDEGDPVPTALELKVPMGPPEDDGATAELTETPVETGAMGGDVNWVVVVLDTGIRPAEELENGAPVERGVIEEETGLAVELEIGSGPAEELEEGETGGKLKLYSGYPTELLAALKADTGAAEELGEEVTLSELEIGAILPELEAIGKTIPLLPVPEVGTADVSGNKEKL